jgi:PAS domain S-box-containing protein
MLDRMPLLATRMRGATTMLGQIRTLFLVFPLIWPAFGLWGMDADLDSRRMVLAIAAAVFLAGWLYAGYRRQSFPAWSWILEGGCVACVAAASSHGATVGLCLVWVNFRALYGRGREKFLAAGVIVAIMTAGILVFDDDPASTLPMAFTALVSLVVNHVIALACNTRDRSTGREAAMVSAGAGLAASGTRAEAMDVILGAALGLDREVGAALMFTVAGKSLHVVAAAGDVGDDAFGWITALDELPLAARNSLQPGGYAVVTGESATRTTEALRLPPHAAVAMAPLTANDHVFGMLVLALDRRPLDDLSAAMTTLAAEAALTLDQLLLRSRLSIVVEHSSDALMLAGEAGGIRFVNPAAGAMLDRPKSELVGCSLWSLLHPDDVADLSAPAAQGVTPVPRPCRIRGRDDAAWIDAEATVEYVNEDDGTRSIVFNARDISERQRLELELRHSQKLESVGRLAAGIAHEINTPIQFVGDNVRFLDTAFADLGRLLAAYHELSASARAAAEPPPVLAEVDEVAADIEIDFILEEVPTAIAQTLDGISRVANIVRAMKAFGHPGSDEKARADLNEAIGHTIVVAMNEIKYVADVVTDFGALPLVDCHLGDINQVVLNLVVNAAHAIGSADRGRGTIRVSTRVEEGYAVIEVADTGTGVPQAIADKLFDPFFTTKEVGTGTGQGLALVRTLVTDRHGGTIDFTSEIGVGSVFTVRLPVAAELTAAA